MRGAYVIYTILSELVYQKIQKDSKKAASHLRETIEKLGPTFIKFGQALSTRPDVLSKEYLAELEKLQESIEPITFEEFESIIHQEIGQNTTIKKVHKIPISSASIGQVHKAILKNNDVVVIKAIKPQIPSKIKKDIKILRRAASIIKFRPLAAKYNPVKVVEEYATWINQELDMRKEEENLLQIKNNLQEVNIIIPKTYSNFTTKNILVMSYEKGTRIRDYEFKSKEDSKTFALNAIQIATTMIFKDGHFHADPHGGNIYVGENETPLYFDFGMCGKLTEENRVKVLHIFDALFRRNTNDALGEFCNLSENNSGDQDAFFKEAAPLIKEWYGKSINSISLTTMIQNVMFIGATKGYKFNPDIILLVKTLYNLEGMTLQIYPQFSYEEVVKEEVEKLIKKEYSVANICDEITKVFTIRNLFKIKDLLEKGSELSENKINGNDKKTINYQALIIMATVGLATIVFLFKEMYFEAVIIFLLLSFSWMK